MRQLEITPINVDKPRGCENCGACCKGPTILPLSQEEFEYIAKRNGLITILGYERDWSLRRNREKAIRIIEQSGICYGNYTPKQVVQSMKKGLGLHIRTETCGYLD